MKKNYGFGFALAALLLAGIICLASAVPGDSDDIGIMATITVGSMSTNGGADTASVSVVGPVTAPAGQNTFRATYKHTNDLPLDGQGAIYRLTVYDSRGVAHTTEKKVDSAASGEITVSFDSRGSGDAEYSLWCETHDFGDREMASATDYDDLDYV